MKKKDFSKIEWPTAEQLEQELRREKRRRRGHFFVRGLAAILLITLFISIAVAFIWMPVLRINGDAMAPALQDGEVVIAVSPSEIEAGDIIAFYYNNKLLIKRVIAKSGDEINVDLLGNVDVNGVRLDEPYVSNKAQGDCDVKMPYKVPTGYVFVMGDKRSNSLDSRSSAIGCVAEEQILGRVCAQVWPLEEMQWIGREPWADWEWLQD